MKNRESKLFENPIIVSGIFMDPRYNVILMESMIREAKNCLLQTYARLEKISDYPSTTEHNSTTEHMSNDPDEGEFEQLFKDAESIRIISNSSQSNTLQCGSLENEIEVYLKEPRLKNSGVQKKTTETL